MTLSHARLDSRALLRVAAPDWRPFLHNLLTQDVESLLPGQCRFAALLTPQGRLLHDLFLHADADGCTLECAAEARDALLTRLRLYRLRAKVDLDAIEGAPRVLFGADPASVHEGWSVDPRSPALGFRAIAASAPPDAVAATEHDYRTHQLALGVPDPSRDRLPETYPIEADYDLLNGIDFQKGCFIGQETTSRMKRRGAIKTRMLPLTFDGPPPAFGAEVLAGELRAGQALSGVEGRAMALLRLDRIADAELTLEGRKVRVERPSWFPA